MCVYTGVGARVWASVYIRTYLPSPLEARPAPLSLLPWCPCACVTDTDRRGLPAAPPAAALAAAASPLTSVRGLRLGTPPAAAEPGSGVVVGADVEGGGAARARDARSSSRVLSRLARLSADDEGPSSPPSCARLAPTVAFFVFPLGVTAGAAAAPPPAIAVLVLDEPAGDSGAGTADPADGLVGSRTDGRPGLEPPAAAVTVAAADVVGVEVPGAAAAAALVFLARAGLLSASLPSVSVVAAIAAAAAVPVRGVLGEALSPDGTAAAAAVLVAEEEEMGRALALAAGPGSSSLELACRRKALPALPAASAIVADTGRGGPKAR
jgi:hypothetical protein